MILKENSHFNKTSDSKESELLNEIQKTVGKVSQVLRVISPHGLLSNAIIKSLPSFSHS